MSIRSSPLLGYNNNVRHKGRVFHIQTEDSGIKYGHIMTHLFTDGGRIVKSVKTSYAEYLTSERMTEIVREMMKQQHKAMFIALRDGKFESVAETPSEILQGSRQVATSDVPAQHPPGSVDAKRQAGIPPPPPPRTGRPPGVHPAQRSRDPGPIVESPDSLREPEELTLDVERFERAAEAADPLSSAQRTASDLPPPPADLLREKTAAPAPRSSVPAPPPIRRLPGGIAASAERRYAPTRPASIFGQARPQQGRSIFGEDLMGDKSLDEVILSYLADDPGDENKK
jgi:hypothetical protein